MVKFKLMQSHLKSRLLKTYLNYINYKVKLKK